MMSSQESGGHSNNMVKEDLFYAIGGIALGLVVGFLVANWTKAGVRAGTVSSSSGSAGRQSVNSSPRTDLPPGHPEVGGAQAESAQPALPEGHPTVGGESSQPAPSGSVELPSLDPLPASSKEKRVETDHKNIQMLKGLPSERLEKIMFSFQAALGVDCTYCHIKDQW